MKRLLLLAAIIIATSFSYESEAQPVGKFLEKKLKQATKRAGEKADEEITEEMNKKVDRAVENAFDSLFNDSETNDRDSENQYSSSSSEAMAAAMMKSMGINNSPANVADSYDYNGNIKMIIQSWNEKGESQGEMDYTTYISDDFSGFAMEFSQDNHQSLMIFDTKEGAMIILTDTEGSKTGIVTTYEVDSLWGDEDITAEEIEDYSKFNENLKKTGNTKMIAGYSCDEYIYEDEEAEGTVWMTDELPAELWAKMFNTNVLAASNAGYYGGFVMEMLRKDKETEEKMILQVKEVNENQPKSISTKDYQLMSFGGMMEENPEEEAEQ
ncbi:MAG: DUF4412 domain-containing protein [Bacteroidales bacterium]